MKTPVCTQGAEQMKPRGQTKIMPQTARSEGGHTEATGRTVRRVRKGEVTELSPAGATTECSCEAIGDKSAYSPILIAHAKRQKKGGLERAGPGAGKTIAAEEAGLESTRGIETRRVETADSRSHCDDCSTVIRASGQIGSPA